MDSQPAPAYNPLLVERQGAREIAVVTFRKLTSFAEAELSEYTSTAKRIAEVMRDNFKKGYGNNLIVPYLYLASNSHDIEPKGFRADSLDEFLGKVTVNSRTSKSKDNFRVVGFTTVHLDFLNIVNKRSRLFTPDQYQSKLQAKEMAPI